MRGYSDEGATDAIRAAGGEVYAITSEPHSLALNAQMHWVTGFEHVGDPHQEILGTCRERGWISLFVNEWDTRLNAANEWASHPKGYLQPGVLALSREGRVLYRWRSRPNRQNLGGALARPTAAHVWRKVQAAFGAPRDAADAGFDEAPELDSGSLPWPVFVTLLLANGWFLRPTAPDPGRTGDAASRRHRNALLRIPLFIGLWVAAFAYLPAWLVGLALVGWVAKVLPGIRQLSERFQSVGANEEPA